MSYCCQQQQLYHPPSDVSDVTVTYDLSTQFLWLLLVCHYFTSIASPKTPCKMNPCCICLRPSVPSIGCPGGCTSRTCFDCADQWLETERRYEREPLIGHRPRRITSCPTCRFTVLRSARQSDIETARQAHQGVVIDVTGDQAVEIIQILVYANPAPRQASPDRQAPLNPLPRPDPAAFDAPPAAVPQLHVRQFAPAGRGGSPAGRLRARVDPPQNPRPRRRARFLGNYNGMDPAQTLPFGQLPPEE